MNALLYTPLPTERPEQIAQVLSGRGARIAGFVKHTYKRYTSFRDMNTSFAALVAIRDVTVPIGDTRAWHRRGGADRCRPRRSLQRKLLRDARRSRGARPGFHSDYDQHAERPSGGRHQRSFVAHAFHLADPQPLGRVTYSNGHPFTVIGIALALFTGTVFANETDFWAPLMMQGQFGAPP